LLIFRTVVNEPSGAPLHFAGSPLKNLIPCGLAGKGRAGGGMVNLQDLVFVDEVKWLGIIHDS